MSGVSQVNVLFNGSGTLTGYAIAHGVMPSWEPVTILTYPSWSTVAALNNVSIQPNTGQSLLAGSGSGNVVAGDDGTVDYWSVALTFAETGSTAYVGYIYTASSPVLPADVPQDGSAVTITINGDPSATVGVGNITIATGDGAPTFGTANSTFTEIVEWADAIDDVLGLIHAAS